MEYDLFMWVHAPLCVQTYKEIQPTALKTTRENDSMIEMFFLP